MQKTNFAGIAILAGIALPLMSSCVDHDYDLSKDIDLTVTLGGQELTVPTSDTDIYTLEQILNLSPTSSVRAVATEGEYGLAKGDYVLDQSANTSYSKIEVREVNISEIHGSTSDLTLAPFIGTGLPGRLTVFTQEPLNNISLTDDDVTTELVTLSNAETDIAVNFVVSFSSAHYNGPVFLEPGFTIHFDDAWTLEVDDPVMSQYVSAKDPHTVVFDKEYCLNTGSSVTVHLKITNIDFSELPEGQGLYAPGHFKLDADVLSEGNVSIIGDDFQVGQRAFLDLRTITNVTSAVITRVTGMVNPDLNIDPSGSSITGVPDFLANPENNFDLTNPRVYITVTNDSPIELDINGKIRATYKDGHTKEIGIGDKYGSSPIIVGNDGVTRLCLSLTGTGAVNGEKDIKVPTLDQLLTSIPTYIEFYDAEAKAVHKEYTFDLGTHFDYYTDYHAIVPLAFNKDLRFFYDTTAKDWDADLHKYNFKEAEATIDVYNTIPMDMEPHVTAIDRQGNDMPNVKAEITGTVDAGSLDKPSTTTMKVHLTSDGENLAGLDGVRVHFEATGNQQYQGINLNQAQYIRFDNIKLHIIGGVTVDLN